MYSRQVANGVVKCERPFDAEHVYAVNDGFKVGLDLNIEFEDVGGGELLVSLNYKGRRKLLFSLHPTGFIDYTGKAQVDEAGLDLDTNFDDYGGVELSMLDFKADENARVTGTIEMVPTRYPSWRGEIDVVIRSWVKPKEFTPWPEAK